MDQRSFSVPRASRPEFHAEPRFVKTEEIPVADLAKIRRLSAEAASELRDERKGRFSAAKYRSMLMGILLGLANTSVLPQGLREEIMDAEMSMHEEKTHVEIGPGGVTRVEPNVDHQKERMTQNSADGVYARAQARREPFWRAYAANKLRFNDVVTTMPDPTAGEEGVILSQNRTPLYENLRRMPEGPFLEVIREQVFLEMGMLWKQKDLPVGEELSVVVDRAIERSLRRALIEAKQRGIAQTGLTQADNQAMLQAIQALTEFTYQHREQHSGREIAALIACINERAQQKRAFHTDLSSESSDQGASIPTDVMNHLATTRSFELFSPQEEREREQWVQARESYEIAELLMKQSDWFVAHLPRLLQNANAHFQENFEYALQIFALRNPSIDHHTRRKFERMQRLIRMSRTME